MIFKFLSLPILLLANLANSQENLESEMKRMETSTVLIVNSQQIEHYPIWSPNSDAIAYNIDNKWYKINLQDVQIQPVKWRGQMIGYLPPSDDIKEMTPIEIDQFKQVSPSNAREVKTSNGTTVALPMSNLRTSLVVTRKGEPSKTLWTSGGENCHSLVLSPNQKYVAYLCELNGLLVMKL